MMFSTRSLVLGLALVLTLAPLAAFSQEQALTQEEILCGTLRARMRVPPHDYRTDRSMLQVVEKAHFPPATEHLIKPRFIHFGSDLDYTLYAFPNHHRALVTMVKLGEREKTDQPKGLSFTVDCGFRRAIRFVPDDLVVRMLYAQYLGKQERREDALAQLSYVDASAGDDPVTRNNLGLLYLELKEYDKAREQAWRSADTGLPRLNLKEKLVAAGQWRDPPAAPAGASASASSADAASAPGRAKTGVSP